MSNLLSVAILENREVLKVYNGVFQLELIELIFCNDDNDCTFLGLAFKGLAAMFLRVARCTKGLILLAHVFE